MLDQSYATSQTGFQTNIHNQRLIESFFSEFTAAVFSPSTYLLQFCFVCFVYHLWLFFPLHFLLFALPCPVCALIWNASAISALRNRNHGIRSPFAVHCSILFKENCIIVSNAIDRLIVANAYLLPYDICTLFVTHWTENDIFLFLLLCI